LEIYSDHEESQKVLNGVISVLGRKKKGCGDCEGQIKEGD
jgi:hypothetical protein